MFDYLFERLSCYIPDSFVGGFTVGIICTLLVVQAVKESGTLVGLICSVYTHRSIRKEQREDEERAEAKEKAKRTERKNSALKLSTLREKERSVHNR